jgi:decaprenyl-phosphate phosphoribosyltransferase
MRDRDDVPLLPENNFNLSAAPTLAHRNGVLAFLRALRPKQWTKNLLVLAAPGAAGVLLTIRALPSEAVAFAAFCLVASAGYLLNDVTDIHQDRRHLEKRHRPVASGEVSLRAAIVGSCVLAVAGLALSTRLGTPFLLAVAGYVIVTAAYSLGLKRIAVLDLLMVAACYVLRAVGGGAAVQVPLSEWFLILTTSGALAVVAGKRAADLTSDADGSADATRTRYTESFLRSVWLLAGGVALVAYCLWAFNVPHKVDGVAWSEVSILPFALAFLRYIYVMDLGEAGAPEEVLGHDRVIQIAVLVWAGIYAWGVYSR